VLYLVIRSLDPNRPGKARWAMRWKPALNAFASTGWQSLHAPRSRRDPGTMAA
jgi:hypothetical protein